MVRRGGWSLADQAISSVTNFAVNLIVLRSVGLREYGAYAIGFAVYLVCLNVARALCTEPLVIRCSDEPPDVAAATARAASGLSLLLGIIGGGLLVVVSLAVGKPIGTALLAFGVGLPMLLLQDSWRFVFFARGTPRAAFVNDLAWGVTQAALFAALVVVGVRGVVPLVLAWASAAGVAALVGVAQAGVLPAIGAGPAWLRRHSDLGLRFVAEFLLTRGAGQLAWFSVGAIAGLAAVGTVNAANLVLGPLQTVLLGLFVFALPEGARALRRSTKAFDRLLLLLALGIAVSAVGWTFAVMAAPSTLLRAVLGRNWLAADTVLLPAAVAIGANGLQQVPRIGMRVLQAARETLRTRALLAPTVPAAAALGAWQGGALGAAWGLAAASSIGAAIWWWEFRRLRDRMRAVSTVA